MKLENTCYEKCAHVIGVEFSVLCW